MQIYKNLKKHKFYFCIKMILCKFHLLNLILFVFLKYKEKNNRKYPSLKKKKKNLHGNMFRLRVNVFKLYYKINYIPLHAKHDLANAQELLRSYIILQERIRRTYELHESGNCMQIASLSKTIRLRKILSHAPSSLAYLVAQLRRNK